VVFRLPGGAEMLTKSGSDMPREQNDRCVVAPPAADAAPATPEATAPMSPGLLTDSKTTTRQKRCH